MEITYREENGVLLPNVTVPDDPWEPGKYGLMHMRWLKENARWVVSKLLMDGNTNRYFAQVGKKAQRMVDDLVEELREKNPGPAKLEDPLGWVRHTNFLINQAEEIIQKEYLFAIPKFPLNLEEEREKEEEQDTMNK